MQIAVQLQTGELVNVADDGKGKGPGATIDVEFNEVK